MNSFGIASLPWPQIAHPTAWEIQDKPPSRVSERIGDTCSIQMLAPKKHPPPIIKWLQNYIRVPVGKERSLITSKSLPQKAEFPDFHLQTPPLSKQIPYTTDYFANFLQRPPVSKFLPLAAWLGIWFFWGDLRKSDPKSTRRIHREVGTPSRHFRRFRGPAFCFAHNIRSKFQPRPRCHKMGV